MDEFDLIKKYIKSTAQAPVVVGPGDDCSVVDFNNTHYLVQTTDSLVEDIHFRLRDFTPEELAFKCLAVNISDIVAMGALPKRMHLSMALPKSLQEKWVKAFLETLYSCLEPLNVSLLGGDLCASPSSLFINFHLSGEVKKENLKLRRGLGEESILFVTGTLGDSAAGFFCLENSVHGTEAEVLIHRHKVPPLELQKGAWLGGQASVLGMMDLSDGLLSDLKRVNHGKSVLCVEKIPLSDELRKVASQVGVDPMQWALAGGEDYRLLGACEVESWPDLKRAFEAQFDESLYELGITQKQSEREILYTKKGLPFDVPYQSYSHF